jgi:hypothetical protein
MPDTVENSRATKCPEKSKTYNLVSISASQPVSQKKKLNSSSTFQWSSTSRQKLTTDDW